MGRSTLLLPALLIACADPAPEAKNDPSETAAPAATPVVERPAGASEDPGPMVAVPGDCGSTRAEAFLGRTYDPSMAESMKVSSGASSVRVYRPGGPPLEGGDGRTLNAYLDESGRIVLLDCS